MRLTKLSPKEWLAIEVHLTFPRLWLCWAWNKFPCLAQPFWLWSPVPSSAMLLDFCLAYLNHQSPNLSKHLDSSISSTFFQPSLKPTSISSFGILMAFFWLCHKSHDIVLWQNLSQDIGRRSELIFRDQGSANQIWLEKAQSLTMRGMFRARLFTSRWTGWASWETAWRWGTFGRWSG